jgi:hypothetical protein
MQVVTTIGLDIAKSVFQVHGVDAAGQVPIRRRLKRRAALPEGYAAALETGLWPSCDVLPSKEIRERGVPL